MLKIISIICILFGMSELICALAAANVSPITVPYHNYMLISSTHYSYITAIGFVFASLYILLGIYGILSKHAMNQVKLSAAVLLFHIIIMVLAFFEGGFTYHSIFYIPIPILLLLFATLKTNNRTLRENVIAYSFIAPNLIGFSIFTMLPMGFALALGFMQWNLADNSFTFVGLQNFAQMRTDHLFWPSVRNTLYFTIISVPLTMVFSLSLALLLNNKIKGRAIFRSVMFFPYVASLIAMAAVWNQIFHPSWGPVNQLLTFLGVENPPRWTVTPWVIPNIAFFTTWRNMGYFMIIYLAGLQGIPQELYEAASIDGANTWTKFRYITLPQLRFVTFFVSVMLTITSFRVFDQVIMITNSEQPGSGATMMVVHIFRVAFINWNLGYASAIAFVLLALVLGITIVQFVIQKRYERDY